MRWYDWRGLVCERMDVRVQVSHPRHRLSVTSISHHGNCVRLRTVYALSKVEAHEVGQFLRKVHTAGIHLSLSAHLKAMLSVRGKMPNSLILLVLTDCG